MKRKIFTLFAALIVGASTLFASDAVASVQHDNRSRYVRFQSNDLNLTAEIQSKSTPSNLVSNTTTSLEVNYAQAVYYPSYSTSKAYNWSIDLINLTNSTDYTIGMSIDLNTPTLTRIAGTWTTANGISLTYSSLVFVNGTDTTALAATDVVLTLDYQGQDTDNNPIYTVTATMTCDDDNIYTVSSTLVFYCYNAETDETIIINEPINGIYYIFDDANLTATVAYRGNYSSSYTNEYTGNVVIPATVTYGGKTYSVTSIGSSAFSSCSGLTSVTIPNSVTSIGGSAFSGCSGLTSITIPNSVTSIGSYAFHACSGLTSITIPNSVTIIGHGAFDYCSGLTSVVWNAKNCADDNCSFFGSAPITSFTFGSEVEHIPAYLCYGMSNLTSVTIPNSVTSIGGFAFDGCSGLHSVVWNAKNCADFEYSNYAPFYDIASPITSFTFGDAVEHIPSNLCYGLSSLNAVTIPNSVTSIGDKAFAYCSGLTSITIPNSVTNISYYAFAECRGLTSVTIPNSVTIIGHGAFYYCSGLTSVTIPNSVTSIGEEAFQGCRGLTSVTIPNSVTSIGDKAFAYCSGLTSITIPNSVTNISYYAFAECSGLTSVTIGNSVTSIEDEAFSGCGGLRSVVWNAKNYADFNSDSGPFYAIRSKITSFTFGDEVEHIPAYLCEGMENLTSVTIPNSVTSIGEYAFRYCSGLTSVTIPNSVTSIGDKAFYGCSGLTSVTIGNSVKSIGERAFYECTKLVNIVCYAAVPPSCNASSVFANYDASLKVPCNNLMAYQIHAVWGSFKYISCVGSEEVQVTEFSVTPSTNDVQFTWPAESGAATYDLVISKDGVVFCTLTFNASGQLMGIAFAPGANTAATTATSGFQFTVTGLNEASHYTYTFDAKDAGGSVVKHYAGEFNTDGFVGLGQIELADLYTQAGRIVCEGEFRIYDLLGRDVTRLNGSLSGVYVVKTANAAQKVVVK